MVVQEIGKAIIHFWKIISYNNRKLILGYCMDHIILDNNILHFSRGTIEEIMAEGNNLLVTVSYRECRNCNQSEEKIRLVVGNSTVVVDESGYRVSENELVEGMVINANYSAAMTRSIPPQAVAYLIRIVSRPEALNVTIGRIIDVDRQNRSITTISDRNMSSVIRFIVPEDAVIQNLLGRPIRFSELVPGLRVRVHHAEFMTASIPPQTTAFEIRVIR